MSFEGYYQLLCKKGHYWTVNTYGYDEEDGATCPYCLAKPYWSNLVDITNGSFDIDHNGDEDTAKRIDGYVELIPVSTKQCDKCNSILEQTYKIPKKGRIK